MRTNSLVEAEKKFERENKPTHKIPSGLGGIFHVRLLKDLGDKALIRMVDKYWKGSQYYLSEYEVPTNSLIAA